MPIGTHRQSLAEALSQWGWSAKPMQPARDARGRAWEVGSNDPPPDNFLPSKDGLVTVTLIRETSVKPQVQNLIVGKKTRDAIQRSAVVSSAPADSQFGEAGDPWANYLARKSSSSSSAAPASVTPAPASAKIVEVETRLKDAVKTSVMEEFGKLEAGVNVSTDQRIAKLECDMVELRAQGQRFEQWFVEGQSTAHKTQEQIVDLHARLETQAGMTSKLVGCFEECSDKIGSQQTALHRVAGEVHAVKTDLERTLDGLFSKQSAHIEQMILRSRNEADPARASIRSRSRGE